MLNINIKRNQLISKSETLGDNRLSTTLYNRYNFLPLAIFNQLKKFTNIYFIIIAILAVIPMISPIGVFAVTFVTLLVISIAIIFDLLEDFSRYRSDRKINEKTVEVIREGTRQMIKSKDIVVGDILVVEEDDAFMADVVLLAFKSKASYAYIDMSSLDGEKNLKPKLSIFSSSKETKKEAKKTNIKESIKAIERVIAEEKDLEESYNEPCFTSSEVDGNIDIKNLEISYNKNTPDLYSFEGNCFFVDFDNASKEAGLDIVNFIPRSAVLKSTWGLWACCLYR